jgi:prepilin-type N-terminal cleavage/methylation domain-containing protein
MKRGRGTYVMSQNAEPTLNPHEEDSGMNEDGMSMDRAYQTKPFWCKYRAAGRGGFTLIELLIVLVVVLLLAGLLLGAVLVVRGRVRVAQQVAELTQLDLALATFKSKYGIFPPSRIRLREWQTDAAGSLVNGTTPYLQNDAFDQHSVAYLRRIWPSIKLLISNGGPSPVETPGPNSIGQWFQDNSTSPAFTPRVYELEGDECLVFFLGGICEKTGTDKYILHGFTDDASNPSRIPNGAIARTQKRIASTFLFDVGRLYQRAAFGDVLRQTQLTGLRRAETSPTGVPLTDFLFGTTALGPGPGFLPSYKIAGADQSRPLPLAYFSAYEGRGYRPDDLNIPAANTDGIVVNPDHELYFQLTWPQVTTTPVGPAAPRPATPLSLGPNPYSRNSANPDPLVRGAPVGSRIQPYNPQTYQIILPGADNEFGAGGAQLDYSGTGTSLTTNWLSNEDNLTNFTGGAPIGEFVNQQTQK